MGNDVDEEVVSRDVPVSTPVMKAKALRVPLRERTNKSVGDDVSGKLVSVETDAESTTTPTKASPGRTKPAASTHSPDTRVETPPGSDTSCEMDEEVAPEMEEDGSEADLAESEVVAEKGTEFDLTESETQNETAETETTVIDGSADTQDRTAEVQDDAAVEDEATEMDSTSTEMDSTSVDKVDSAMALLREGLRVMRAGGVDPNKILLSLCVNPEKPNAREAASTVVARLVASLDEAGIESPSATREEDDVFATASNSPMGSVASMDGTRGGANANAGARSVASMMVKPV